jgi:hypothetical protein
VYVHASVESKNDLVHLSVPQVLEEDAADIKARKAREAEAAQLAAEKKKSQVGVG